MSENNIDKFSLDEILSEYTPKTAKSSGEMDVEDIINETNLHTAMAASAEIADRVLKRRLLKIPKIQSPPRKLTRALLTKRVPIPPKPIKSTRAFLILTCAPSAKR